MSRFSLLIFLMLLILTSCRSAGHLSDVEDEADIGFEYYYSIGDFIEKDPEIEKWLESAREIYRDKMDHAVATATSDFSYGQPESSMGNLAADILRYRATHEMYSFVHIALISNEALQIEFEKGEITLEDIYAALPYNHTLVISELEGRYVRDLANEIAALGGVPVSGLRMTIHDGFATGILVDSEHLESDKMYYVAMTSDVANGNAGFNSLKQSSVRYDTSLFVRDIFIDYLTSRKVFTPFEDQRIRGR